MKKIWQAIRMQYFMWKARREIRQIIKEANKSLIKVLAK
jgi:hypothetical protein